MNAEDRGGFGSGAARSGAEPRAAAAVASGRSREGPASGVVPRGPRLVLAPRTRRSACLGVVVFEPVGKVRFPELEEGVLAWWKEADVFRRSLAQREGAPTWLFYEGPPTANGTMILTGRVG